MVHQTTQIIPYFDSTQAATRTAEIFQKMWMNNASDRAILTLYSCLAGGTDVTPEYLAAIGALQDPRPLAMSHNIPMVNYKRVPDDATFILESVASGLERRKEGSKGRDTGNRCIKFALLHAPKI